MAGPTALLDASMLQPAGLRDLLLRPASCYLFAPPWSADIHAKRIGKLPADRPDIDAAVLDRARVVMDGHFPMPSQRDTRQSPPHSACRTLMNSMCWPQPFMEAPT